MDKSHRPVVGNLQPMDWIQLAETFELAWDMGFSSQTDPIQIGVGGCAVGRC